VHIPFIIAEGSLLTNNLYYKSIATSAIGRITKGGATCSAFVHTRDIYATIKELAGIPAPGSGTRSISLVELMKNPGLPGRDYLFTEGDSCNFAIRNKEYKLIVQRGKRDSLYKIDSNKWEETATYIDLYSGLLSADEITTYNLLAGELTKRLGYCICKCSWIPLTL